MTGLFSLPPKQFSLLASLIGLLLIDGLDLGEQNSLGNFLVGVGQAILTAAAQEQALQDKKQKDSPPCQHNQHKKIQTCSL